MTTTQTHPTNVFLAEIFAVARQEARYKNGEIDGATEICVMVGDEAAESYDWGNDEASFPAENDRNIEHTAKQTAMTNDAMRSPACIAEANLSVLSGDSNIGELPVRVLQSHPFLMNDMARQHSFAENGTLLPHRRAETFVSHSKFNLGLELSSHSVIHQSYTVSDVPSGKGSLFCQKAQISANEVTGPPAYASTEPEVVGCQSKSQCVSRSPNQSFMPPFF